MELFSGLGLGILAPFYAPGVLLLLLCFCLVFRLARCRLCTGGGPHTLVLVGMSVSVCRDASLQFHAELWELMVMIDMSARTARRCSGIQWLTLVSRLREESVGSPVLPGRLYSSLCNQTRTLSWISRVAMEIVFRSLRSEKDALLDQPCWPPGNREICTLVFQPLQSDTDALLDQPCCQGDCVPAFTSQTRKLIARGESDAIISLWWH